MILPRGGGIYTRAAKKARFPHPSPVHPDGSPPIQFMREARRRAAQAAGRGPRGSTKCFSGERTSSGANELCRMRQSERCGACEDARSKGAKPKSRIAALFQARAGGKPGVAQPPERDKKRAGAGLRHLGPGYKAPGAAYSTYTRGTRSETAQSSSYCMVPARSAAASTVTVSPPSLP